MRILDRYILKSVLNIFFLCLFTFFFLYIIIDLFSHLDVILQNKIGPETIKLYYLTFLPAIFIQISPFACLLATLYTFAKLNQDNEIIAMRSSGLSIFQITKTAVIFGFIVSIFVFWVNDKIAPAYRLENLKIKEQMENDNKKPKTKNTQILRNLTIYGSKNRLFYVNKFDPIRKTMEGIIILEHDVKQNIIRKIVANRGEYKNNLWEFYQCITYIFDENGQLLSDPQFLEEETMPFIETPEEFTSQKQSTDFMSLAQIEDYIWRLSKSGATAIIRNLKVDYYQRFTLPLTSLIIILIGIPFSFKMHRKSTGMSSFGISLILGFVYYVLTAVSINLGKAGILAPLLSVSVSHFIMLLLSTYLIGKIP